MLEYRNEPFRYRLSAERCRGENPELLLLVSEAFATRIAELDRNHLAVEQLRDELFDAGTSFDGGVSEETSFGFNSALRIGSWENGVLPFRIPIPVVEYEGEEHCMHCNGEGEDAYGNGACFSCDGSGKERVIDYQRAFEVSATLTAFSSIFPLMPTDFEETDVPPLQLLHFFTITVKDMHGGSLGGAYSEPLVSWLSRFPARSPLVRLSEAMKAVFYHSFPPKGRCSPEDLHLHATVEDRGWLNITCPGDACGLNPEYGFRMGEGKGYRFSCHNVDNPVQQLTLLAALGALSDMAAQDGVGQ